ncbi:hypothetical protein V5N11_003378 [Cardamine amara subsp. amara]|uniref:Myb/SANT-like domain-containing protein n=1 Tax=Cardamine amara subsp. amara TaxID=228776 RepID=A0ABD1BU31_CARAN
MTSNRRQNTNAYVQRDTSVSTETSTRSAYNFKWTPVQEIIFLEWYDQALAMNNYHLKDPTHVSKKFVVDKFNEEFGLNITYKFFKEKLDQLKKIYKKYLGLMDSTGIMVDHITSEISASESWWKDREVICKIVHSFKRKPPQLWDVMQHCFTLYNVQSQSQYSVNHRREEMMNEGATNIEDHMYPE